MKAHQHQFTRSTCHATVEICRCGRFRFTEHAGPSIEAVESPVERCNTCGLVGTHANGCTQVQRDIKAARRLQATIDEHKKL